MPNIISNDSKEIIFRKRSVSNVRFFISELAMNDMIDHCAISGGNEIMGLMIGKVFRDDGGVYATAERTATSDLISSTVSVKFDTDSMERLFDVIDGLKEDETVTGWYHSHPGFGCFMSETDVRTHKGIFGDDRFAVVIDPIRQEIAAFGTVADEVNEIQFIIMED